MTFKGFKPFIAFLLTLILVFTLSACGNPGENVEVTTAPPTTVDKEEAKVTLMEAYDKTFKQGYFELSVEASMENKATNGNDSQESFDSYTQTFAASNYGKENSLVLEKRIHRDITTYKYIVGNDSYTKQILPDNATPNYGKGVFDDVSTYIPEQVNEFLAFGVSHTPTIETLFSLDYTATKSSGVLTVSATLTDAAAYMRLMSPGITDENVEKGTDGVKSFSYTLTAVVGADGFIQSISHSTGMDAAKDDMTQVVNIKGEMKVSNVNANQTVTEPEWVAECKKQNP